MSELIEGLERIYSRLATLVPHYVRALQAPLSSEEIEVAVQDLPFTLPSEVYELYQWRNGLVGWNFLFEQYEFMPLRTAVYEYQGELRQVQADYPEVAKFFQFRFPLFQLWSQGDVFLTVVPNDKGESPIHNYDISSEDYSLGYHSLTDLISHSAEWYEAAMFDEEDKQWIIDNDLECRLEVKFMARECILKRAKHMSIYQRLLDESSASS